MTAEDNKTDKQKNVINLAGLEVTTPSLIFNAGICTATALTQAGIMLLVATSGINGIITEPMSVFLFIAIGVIIPPVFLLFRSYVNIARLRKAKSESRRIAQNLRLFTHTTSSSNRYMVSSESSDTVNNNECVSLENEITALLDKVNTYDHCLSHSLNCYDKLCDLLLDIYPELSPKQIRNLQPILIELEQSLRHPESADEESVKAA